MLRFPFALTLLTAAVGPAQASVPPVIAETEEPETRIDASFAPGHRSSGVLPIHLVNGSRIYVPASVNGRSVPVLLDTGAAWTVVDKRLAAEIGLKPTGHRRTRGTGGATASQYAFGVSIDLGHLRLRHVTVLVMDMAPVEQRLGIKLPLIVGPEAFGTVIADLNIPARKVAFHSRETWQPPLRATRIPAVPVEGARAVKLSIEDRPEAPFVFDIGNGTTPLRVHPHYAKQHGLLAGRRTATAMSGGIGGERPVTVARLRHVRFGGVTFRDLPAHFPPDDGSTASRRQFAGNVGMPLLGRFRLITDFASNSLWLIPGPQVASEFPRDRSGITFSRSSEGLQIRALAGHAAASGLKVGDVIVAVKTPGKEWTTVSSAVAWNTAIGPVQLKLASGAIKRLQLRDYF